MFLKNFKKPPDGLFVAAKQLMQFQVVSGFLNEVSGSDEHPPGDASQFESIFMFWGFWDDFDRGKRQY